MQRGNHATTTTIMIQHPRVSYASIARPSQHKGMEDEPSTIYRTTTALSMELAPCHCLSLGGGRQRPMNHRAQCNCNINPQNKPPYGSDQAKTISGYTCTICASGPKFQLPPGNSTGCNPAISITGFTEQNTTTRLNNQQRHAAGRSSPRCFAVTFPPNSHELMLAPVSARPTANPQATIKQQYK